MQKSNEQWLIELEGEPTARDGALEDLRRYLVAGLSRVFLNQGGVDAGFIDDVVQETLIKVIGGLAAFEGRSRLTTWVMSIGVRVGYTELRKRRWKDVSLDDVLQGTGFVHAGPADSLHEPEGAAQRHAVVNEMYKIINDNLTPKQRDVLLAELKGMPQEEIGRRTGSNRNAVYKLTHDARKRLKAGLEAKGYTAADVSSVFEW